MANWNRENMTETKDFLSRRFPFLYYRGDWLRLRFLIVSPLSVCLPSSPSRSHALGLYRLHHYEGLFGRRSTTTQYYYATRKRARKCLEKKGRKRSIINLGHQSNWLLASSCVLFGREWESGGERKIKSNQIPSVFVFISVSI